MVSAILSLVCAVFAALGGPLGAPAIGLALGANAALKENRLPERRPPQKALGWIGIALNGLFLALILLH